MGFGGGAPDKQKQVTVEITACELDECAEPLIIGLQDLQKWGMQQVESYRPDRALVAMNKLDLMIQSAGNEKPGMTSATPARLWASATTIVPAEGAVMVPIRYVGLGMAFGVWARETGVQGEGHRAAHHGSN